MILIHKLSGWLTRRRVARYKKRAERYRQARISLKSKALRNKNKLMYWENALKAYEPQSQNKPATQRIQVG